MPSFNGNNHIHSSRLKHCQHWPCGHHQQVIRGRSASPPSICNTVVSLGSTGLQSCQHGGSINQLPHFGSSMHAMGCPMFSTSVVLTFNAPSSIGAYSAAGGAARLASYIPKHFSKPKVAQWPCNYSICSSSICSSHSSMAPFQQSVGN